MKCNRCDVIGGPWACPDCGPESRDDEERRALRRKAWAQLGRRS